MCATHSDDDARTVTIPAVNLADVLLAPAATAPDSPALVGGAGPVTFADLAARAGGLATMLAARGVSPGDRVAIVAPNSVEFVVAYLGVLGSGAVAVPMNPTAPPAELAREAAAVEPRLMLVAGHAGVD